MKFNSMILKKIRLDKSHRQDWYQTAFKHISNILLLNTGAHTFHRLYLAPSSGEDKSKVYAYTSSRKITAATKHCEAFSP